MKKKISRIPLELARIKSEDTEIDTLNNLNAHQVKDKKTDENYDY